MAVDLRLIGDESEIKDILSALHRTPGVRVIRTSGARPTRYNEGVRVYATVEETGVVYAEETARGAEGGSPTGSPSSAADLPGSRKELE